MKFEKCGQRVLATAILLLAVFGSAASVGAATFDSNNGNSNGNGNNDDGNSQSGDGGSGYPSLSPVLECLATNRNAAGSVTGYTAVFGYSYAGLSAYSIGATQGVTIPVGTYNNVTGSTWTGTQVTSFPYGTNGRAVGVMRLNFNSGSLKWTLASSSVQATVGSSKDCSPAAQVPEGPAGVLAISGLAAAGAGAFWMMRRNRSHALTA
jgi:hypothetical protein